MTMHNQNVGRHGEDLAVEYLTKHGYEIISRNYRKPFGEIDIIARDNDTLCFVEVKTRKSDSHGSPFEAISPGKKRRMIKAALSYMQDTNQLDVLARFDVIAISPEGSGEEGVDLLQNAFDTI